MIKSRLELSRRRRPRSGVLDRVLGGFEASEAGTFGITAGARRRRPGAAPAGACDACGCEPALVHVHHRAGARDARCPGAHPGRVAPRQRRAAQAGAGRGAARWPRLRDSRRRQGARHRRCCATGSWSRPELELEGVSADDALATLIQRVEAPRRMILPSRRWYAVAAALAADRAARLVCAPKRRCCSLPADVRWVVALRGRCRSAVADDRSRDLSGDARSAAGVLGGTAARR